MLKDSPFHQKHHPAYLPGAFSSPPLIPILQNLQKNFQNLSAGNLRNRHIPDNIIFQTKKTQTQ